MGIRSQNNPIAAYLDVFSRSGTDAATAGGGGAAPSGMTASGGIVSDYSDSGDVYRAHVFTSTGTFDVTALSPNPSSYPDEIDILLIGGGGGGGSQHGGGGGAGGWVTKTSYPIPSSVPAPYTVTIGAGGRGGLGGGTSAAINYGGNGGDTEFYAVGASYPGSNRFRAIGGGGGSQYYNGSNPQGGGAAGGSGGGGATNGGGNESAPSTPHGGATQPGANPGTPNIIQYGYDGGVGGNSDAGGGGGGGAGGVGQSRPSSPTQADGGAGRANTYAYGPTNPITYAAGGGSGGNNQTGGNGGNPLAGHGGGQPAPRVSPLHPTVPAGLGGPVTAFEGTMAEPGTGHGGGGSASNTAKSGYGGSGTVVVRYKIGSVATEKATGGLKSYYDGKTIHTFTSSGTFSTTANWTATDVEYLVVGGGGGGGSNLGGGGGAGGLLTNTNHPIGTHPVTVTVQIGAGGGPAAPPSDGRSGNPSYFGSPLTAYGGGGGGTVNGDAPTGTFGSGGGAGGGSAGGQTARAGTVGQGNSGGTCPRVSPFGSGGGGGAGDVGGSDPHGGAGGVGSQAPPTFQNPAVAPSDTSNPQPYQRGGGLGTPGPGGSYYLAAGGGGANTGQSPQGGAGGAGGGGKSGYGTDTSTAPGQYGLENTGSGGGGGAHSPTNGEGGKGGSGIVLIAYPT